MAGTGRIFPKELSCKYCNTLFTTNKPAVKNCSSECTKKYMYERRNLKRKNNKTEYKRYYTEYNLKHSYNISIEDYIALAEKSAGLCGICKKRPKHKLFVDHCHTTGRIRGLLCRKCNIGLGMFEDNINILDSAKAYLFGGIK